MSSSSSLSPRVDDGKGGLRLYSLHKALKMEQLRNKSEQMMVNKIEVASKQLSMTLEECLIDTHELSKKIEIVEEQYSENVALMIGQVNLTREPARIPKKTHELLMGILDRLRLTSHYLCDALARGGWLSLSIASPRVRHHRKLSRVLVVSLFRNAFSPLDEKLLLQFILELCSMQFAVTVTESPSLALSPFFISLTVAYYRFTGVSDFLKLTLGDLLIDIMHDTKLMSGDFSELKVYGERVMTKIKEAVGFVPTGICLIAKVLKQVAFAKGLGEDEMQSLLYQIVFENFYLLCFNTPAMISALTGLEIAPSQKKNLKEIGSQIGGFLDKQFLTGFFRQLTQLNASSYLSSIEEESQFRTFVITKSEIEMILDLIIQVRNLPSATTGISSSKIKNPDDSVRVMLDAFITEEHERKDIKTEYVSLHPTCLVQLTIPLPPPWKTASTVDVTTKQVKSILFCVLSEITFLPGYSNHTVIQTLRLLGSSCWTKSQVSLWAQISAAIKTLNELPQKYKDNDFKWLLDQMFEDHHTRQKEQSTYMDQLLVAWDRLQCYCSRVKHQRKMALVYITSIKIQEFNDKQFSNTFQNFVDYFFKKYGKSAVCKCDVMKSQNCHTCSSKSGDVKAFIEATNVAVSKNPLWNKATEEEIRMAVQNIERSLLEKLWEYVDTRVLDDDSLQLSVKAHTLSLSDMDIAPKYHSGAPWPLVQAELRKIPSFKAPIDKFNCISVAWEVVSNYVSLVDDPGPDACFPIMSYVIYSLSEDINIFSNINYLYLYCNTLSELEGARLLAFRTVVKALLRSLSQQQSIGNDTLRM